MRPPCHGATVRPPISPLMYCGSIGATTIAVGTPLSTALNVLGAPAETVVGAGALTERTFPGATIGTTTGLAMVAKVASYVVKTTLCIPGLSPMLTVQISGCPGAWEQLGEPIVRFVSAPIGEP